MQSTLVVIQHPLGPWVGFGIRIMKSDGKFISRVSVHSVRTKVLPFMEDHTEVIQCNSPTIRQLVGSSGNGALSGATCSSLLLTNCMFSPISVLLGPVQIVDPQNHEK